MNHDADNNRPRLGLNHDWHFKKERVEPSWFKESTAASMVDLPHCWNDKDTFQLGLRYYQGDAAYKRSFQLPPGLASLKSGHWHLVTEGFYGIGDLWLNGVCIAKIDGQYIGIREKLDLMPFGSNTIGVRLDNRYHPQVLPGKKMPDFLLHGGLAGRAILEFEPLLHLDASSLHVHCTNPMSSTPDITLSVVVHNDAAERMVAQLKASIRGPGNSISTSVASKPFSLGAGTSQLVSLSATLQQPRRWSLQTPQHYRLTLNLVDGEMTIDCAMRQFGIRAAEFRRDGFYLNDMRVQLYGTNRHESVPGFGNALPPFLHREDAELMKHHGLNFVRLAHYPQHPEFLDACDELGILVYAEIASWKSVKQGRWLAAACRQMRAMIQRDRHHPSIILWGMGNESRSGPGYRLLHRIAHDLDGTRQTIYAENHLHRGIRRRTLKLPDVLGLNYEIDRLEDAARLSRDGAVLMSECSNCPRTYRGDAASEQRQIDTYRRDLDRIESHKFTAGYCLWSFNDYATQRKERFVRCSGIVDAWRIPKPSAKYLSSRINGSAPGTPGNHGPAKHIAIETEKTAYSATAREAASLLCRIVDASGSTIANWSGDLEISIQGPARERLHNRNRRLPVAAGIGRLFICGSGRPGTVTISARHADLGESDKSVEYVDTHLTIPELPTEDARETEPLANWHTHNLSMSDGSTLHLQCAPGENSLTDTVKQYWSGQGPDLVTVREHNWGGRVQTLRDPHADRQLYFKRFSIQSTRYLHKPPRARNTITQEQAIRNAGFKTTHTLCLAERRMAGIVIDSLVVSEGANDCKSLFSLINDDAGAGSDPVKRRGLLKAAATEIGRFHRSGLFHGDMHLNNLLCARHGEAFNFTWIDNEEGRSYAALPDDRRVHDLKHINRYKHKLTRSERMFMWKTYLIATNDLSRNQQSMILRKVISQSQAYMRKRGWLRGPP